MWDIGTYPEEQQRRLISSDHGDMLGSHGLYDKGPFMYDDIYRVPLMVRAELPPSLVPLPTEVRPDLGRDLIISEFWRQLTSTRRR